MPILVALGKFYDFFTFPINAQKKNLFASYIYEWDDRIFYFVIVTIRDEKSISV